MGIGRTPEIFRRALLEPQYGGEWGGRQADARGRVPPAWAAPWSI